MHRYVCMYVCMHLYVCFCMLGERKKRSFKVVESLIQSLSSCVAQGSFQSVSNSLRNVACYDRRRKMFVGKYSQALRPLLLLCLVVSPHPSRIYETLRCVNNQPPLLNFVSFIALFFVFKLFILFILCLSTNEPTHEHQRSMRCLLCDMRYDVIHTTCVRTDIIHVGGECSV